MIPNIIFKKYKEVADAFINDLGIEFSLHYLNDSENNSGKNYYGGPQVLNDRSFYKEQAQPEEVIKKIKLRFYPAQKYWVKTVVPSTDATAQIIGFISDLENLEKCNFLTKQIGNSVEKFKLAGSPQTHGFLHDRYFIAYLQKII